MDTFSNSPDLSALLARMTITDDNCANGVTPISSPRLAYNQQHCRMPQGSDSASQMSVSLTDGSDSPTCGSSYSDSSFERTIVNLTFEEMAVLSGKEIIEISTDEDSDSERDLSPSRSPSPTIMAMEFSRNPVTHARRVMLVESCNPNGSSRPSQRLHITRTEGPPQSNRQYNLASTSNTSYTNGRVAASSASSNSRTSSSSGWASSPTYSQQSSGPSDTVSELSVAPSSNGPPPTPPRMPPPALLQDRPLYQITTPTSMVHVEGWDNAGPRYLTQSRAHCARLTHRPHHPQNVYPAYTVLKGRVTGVFTCPWDELQDYVLHVPHANYKGYGDIIQAQAAYMVGYSLGLVEVVDDDDGTASDTSMAPSSAVPRHPNTEQIYRALGRVSNTFLGRTWLVVFRGMRPGVYLSWNFVSSMVSGISTSVYKKFEMREEADAQWREAVRAGQVMTLLAGVSYVRRD